MAKITYLFGAGASYGALPIVEEIPERLKLLVDSFLDPKLLLSDNETFPESFRVKLPYSKQTYQRELISDLNWIYNASSKHASIDTFAKKLYLKGDSVSLKKLKIALSAFFVFEQTKNNPNSRYDAFFASILNREMKIPDNIKIVSWNYDYQFERAYSEFVGNFDLDSLQVRLNVQSKNKKLEEEFSIYKLNGTTTIYDNNPRGGFSFIKNINDPFSLSVIEQITHSYALMTSTKDYWQTLSFAWERNYAESNYIDRVFSQIDDSVALVVIGYSFPFFNRDVDRAILSRLESLQKVYIQSPDAIDVAERFSAVKADFDKNNIVPVTNVKQFYLPNEL